MLNQSKLAVGILGYGSYLHIQVQCWIQEDFQTVNISHQKELKVQTHSTLVYFHFL